MGKFNVKSSRTQFLTHDNSGQGGPQDYPQGQQGPPMDGQQGMYGGYQQGWGQQ